MKQGLSLRVSQHLALTPQLQQSIRLLQLSTLELSQEVGQMLDENPFLEQSTDEPVREEFGLAQVDTPVRNEDIAAESATNSIADYATSTASTADNDTEITPLSADDWARIVRVVEADRTVYWRKYGSFGLEKTEQSLPTRRQLAMAIREDFLDFYTRSSAARAILQSEQLEVFESQLRYVEQSIPHRIGGRANMMPFEIGELGEALLFQIATDEPMGWMPEHFDMPCVMTSEKNLQKHLFDQLYITTGGY